MVEFTQATPFVGVVNNARQRKLPKGTEVEVRIIKEGQYGPYALCFVEGRKHPAGTPTKVFLNPNHVDYVSDVTAERQAELDAEKAAWAAKKNAPVIVGRGYKHSGGKCVVIEVSVDLEATDQCAKRDTYFPLSQLSEVNGVYSAPPWLARIKAADAAYYWLSSGGRKGINHLGGAGISASFADSHGDFREGLICHVSLSDLIDAEDRARA